MYPEILVYTQNFIAIFAHRRVQGVGMVCCGCAQGMMGVGLGGVGHFLTQKKPSSERKGLGDADGFIRLIV